MPQLTLYIDKETIKKLQTAAKLEKTSLSSWVRAHILKALDVREWPKEYFKVFGALKDDTFKRPLQPSHKKDSKREHL